MAKSRNKPHVLYPSERLREMVESIQSAKGLNTASAVYFQAVGDMYHKLFPVYQAKRGLGGETQTPEEIARHRIAVVEETRKERERVANAEAAQICTLILKGDVIEDVSGSYCVFNTYNFDSPDEQKVPLNMCTPEFAKYQKVVPDIKK